MKAELIKDLLQKFKNACYDYNGIECWSTRELQEILVYAQWRNFLNALEKAKIACENAGESISDHFADVSKMVSIGSDTKREIDDIALTRYACYSITQNKNYDKKD